MQRYSKRLPWSSSVNAISTRIAEKRATGLPLLDLTVSNPTQALSDYPHAAIAAAHSSISDFTYRPDPWGQVEARRAITGYYGAKNIRISEDQIALTASTSEAYSVLFKLLCDPGDEVLIPVPAYPLLEHLAALDGVETVPYRLCYAGEWFIDFDQLLSSITPRSRAILVVSPSNPAGCYLKATEAATLSAIAAKHELAIVIDEVFVDYPIVEGGINTFHALEETLTFVLNGLSKLACMPQMKLSWMVLHGPRAQRLAASRLLELILDTYLSVGTPVQLMVDSLLRIGSGLRQQLHARVCHNLLAAASILKGSLVNCLHVEGGWSAILKLPAVLPEEQWALRLIDDVSVVVQPGYFFDMPSEPHIVVSLITPPDVFARGVTAIRELVSAIPE